MKPVIVTCLAAIAAAVVSLPGESAAQMSNEPFSFKFRGGGGESVGLSTAHKQLNLERELRGRSRDNPVLRDLSGALLDVERRNGGQAFVSYPSSPYVADYQGIRGGILQASPSGLYEDNLLGGSGIVFGPTTGLVMARWISSLGGDGYRGVQPTSTPLPSASIDAWIGQLQTL